MVQSIIFCSACYDTVCFHHELNCLLCLQFIDVGTMISPTVFARRSLSHLINDMPEEALNDAVQAQVISPVWHIALYLQAASLFALGRENEAQIALKEGSVLEEKRTATSWQWKRGGPNFDHSLSLLCSYQREASRLWGETQYSTWKKQQILMDTNSLSPLRDWFCHRVESFFCHIIGMVGLHRLTG